MAKSAKRVPGATTLMSDLARAGTLQVSTVFSQYPNTPFKYSSPSLRLTFEEGVAMLHAAGVMVDPFEDLSTADERTLGKLVKVRAAPRAVP